MRLKVKICGVTTVEDAGVALAAGADLLGLNFHRPSPRCVTVERAREIAAAVDGRAPLVGVFVNPTPEDLERVVGEARLELVQLHGDEPPALVERWAERAIQVVRSARPSDAKLELAARCWATLFDAPRTEAAEVAGDRDGEELYGGTGRPWNPRAVAELLASGDRRRVFLAGGLDPDNVAGAVAALPGLFGVDVASGVEESPGRKDPARVRSFIQRARGAALSPPYAAASAAARRRVGQGSPSGERAERGGKRALDRVLDQDRD